VRQGQERKNHHPSTLRGKTPAFLYDLFDVPVELFTGISLSAESACGG